MAHPDSETDVSFFLGDWRRELKRWIGENDPSEKHKYLKSSVAKFRLMEFLSVELVGRKKNGLPRMLLEYEIERCGKHGMSQAHKDDSTKRRFVGHYCNNRGYHLPCAMRYRAGQGVEMRNQYTQIAEANKLWGFYSWTFTLPESVKTWLCNDDIDLYERKAFLSDSRRGIAKTIKKCLGLSAKTRGVQPGFTIIFHPCSSGDPFKPSPHFHVIILPMSANLHSSKIKKFDRRFDHALLKKVYAENLSKVLNKYGLGAFVRDRYVVHLYDVELERESSVAHAFRYSNRSQVADILKTVKRVQFDFSRAACLLVDKKEGVLIPVFKSAAQLVDALEYVLNPIIQVRVSYGFMRVLEKYSALLGVARDEFEDSENWLDEYPVDIMRIARNEYNKARQKIITVMDILIRRADSQEEWVKVKPDELRGEYSSMSNRKLYKVIE